MLLPKSTPMVIEYRWECQLKTVQGHRDGQWVLNFFISVSLARPELFAMADERWMRSRAPVLVLCCTPNTSTGYPISCRRVVQELQLQKLNRPWQVGEWKLGRFLSFLSIHFNVFSFETFNRTLCLHCADTECINIYVTRTYTGPPLRGVVAQWWCSVPSVRKVAGLNSTLATT